MIEIDPILRRPEVERMIGFKRAMIYVLLARGDFPKPIKLSSRSVGWRQSAIKAWIDKREAA
jgi:prophage regulatory protein